jgi:DNA polymerase III epsilon subunit-like protein
MLVAAPLLAGCSRCLFHMSTFVVQSAPTENILVTFLDLETTGLSLADDRIVEIGALALLSGAAFSTVVKPVGAQSSAASVHGIEDSELEQGPLFTEAFERLVHFLDTLSETAMASDGESSADELQPLKVRAEPPVICLAAHNGFRFDYPMLLCECLRNNIPWSPMMRWRYVDTLVLTRALDADVYGGCLKLQCLVRRCSSQSDLRAHRALDDSFFLRAVVVNLSQLLDSTVVDLLRPFVVSMDWQATGASLAVLLDL